MKALRKILGLIVYGFFGFACFFGLVTKFIDIQDTFDGVTDFWTGLNMISTWLTEVIIWAIALIIVVIAMIKLIVMKPAQAERKGLSFVMLGAMAEFIGLILLLLIAIHTKQVDSLAVDVVWFPLVASGAVIVGVIIRKTVLRKVVIVGKILSSLLAITMMVISILYLCDRGHMERATWIFFAIAYAALAVYPFLCGPLKKEKKENKEPQTEGK